MKARFWFCPNSSALYDTDLMLRTSNGWKKQIWSTVNSIRSWILSLEILFYHSIEKHLKKNLLSAFSIFLTYDGGEDHEAENERGEHEENKVQVRPFLLLLGQTVRGEVHWGVHYHIWFTRLGVLSGSASPSSTEERKLSLILQNCRTGRSVLIQKNELKFKGTWKVFSSLKSLRQLNWRLYYMLSVCLHLILCSNDNLLIILINFCSNLTENI